MFDPTTELTMQCPTCDAPLSDKAERCSVCGADVGLRPEVAEALAGLLVTAGFAFFVAKAVKWLVRNIDWDRMGQLVYEFLYELPLSDDARELNQRLDLAQSIFDTGEKYTAEMAIALGSGALEAYLKRLRGSWTNGDEPTGLRDLADHLTEGGRISDQDYEAIRWIINLRNPAVHGDLLHTPEEVGPALRWIRQRLQQEPT